MTLKCSLLDLNEAKYFAENISKNSNLYDSGISLPVFLSGNNLKLPNIPVTPKLGKKVRTNPDSSNASGLGWTPVVVLKKREPELHTY